MFDAALRAAVERHAWRTADTVRIRRRPGPAEAMRSALAVAAEGLR